MKLVMTLLVRDEADIIAANLDFHRAAGVDFFIVTDNLSTDETPAILRRYEREGVLLYLHEAGDDYAQHRWVTRMAQMAAGDFGADWVINNDADEFWWPDGGTDLKGCLAACDPAVAALSAPRKNFVPEALHSDAFFAERMTLRETRSCNALGQPLPGKVCHRAAADIQVAQGNHSVSRAGRVLPSAPAALTILHFPLRSYRQFENKIVKGGAAYERNRELGRNVGATWRELYVAWKRGELEAYYRAQVPDAGAVARGLASGRYVRDGRLQQFFRSHCGHAPGVPAGSASPCAAR